VTARKVAGVLLRSAACQAVGVAGVCVLIASLHAHNDGLWFQGDAPRHAANGLFWWDLLTAVPADPAKFALSYYARYPAINPVAYPPFFYLVEALMLGALGTTTYAVRMAVVGFAALSAIYTQAWARRWIALEAGWAGVFVLLAPGIVLWANAILPNIPAMAMSMALLYHFRQWLETSSRTQLILAGMAGLAVVLTYYLAVVVIGVCLVWSLGHARWRNVARWGLVWAWAAAIAVVFGALWVVTAILIPLYLSKHTVPTPTFLLRPATWTYYWRALPELTGLASLIIGLGGLAAAFRTPRWRTEAALLSSWIAVVIFGYSILPARDVRYILLSVPAILLAAANGVIVLLQRLPAIGEVWRVLALASIMGLAGYSAANVTVPRASGFREVAEYLRLHAPNEAVLYDGYYDGNFVFYVRAHDPKFEQRVVLGSQLLYHYGPRSTFDWVETSEVASEKDVAEVIRSRCGCRWLAVEIGPRSEGAATQRLLRRAIHGSAFEPMGSFQVAANGTERVELYRLSGPIPSERSATLRFPAFTDRVFTGIEPISR
jgi:hypothetical protein